MNNFNHITSKIKGGEKLKDTDIKVKALIVVMVIIVITTIGLYIYKTSKEEEYMYYEESIEANEITNEENVIQEETITVHITGEIKYPGVVVLKNGDRIVDAIEAAGGETENADLDRVNLAYVLNDGDKIYIPNKNEEEEKGNIITTENEIGQEKKITININTATLEELIKLPGIGEATANKIIEYRKQNGKFQNIEELKNVPGIGNSKYETLKEMIRAK